MPSQVEGFSFQQILSIFRETNHKSIKMKKLIFTTTLFLAISIAYSQSTAMIAILLEDGKESEYLAIEKNWNIAAQAMVDAGMIAQWSVWKRTPREGDENWAQYYVFRRTTKAQDNNPQNFDNWEEVASKAFKGKSKKKINTDIEEKHEDMEPAHDSGDTEVDGDGSSESTK